MPSDFDFEKQTLRINKTFHRSKGENIITTSKTVKSNQIIKLLPFLCDEIKDYLGMLYEISENERLFRFTRSFPGHEMERGCKQSGVKKSEFTIYDTAMFHCHRVISVTVYLTASDTPFSLASRSAFSRSYLRRI